MRLRALLLLTCGTLLAGCAHKVALTSVPAGAVVSLGGKRIGTTPLTVPIRFLGSRAVRIETVGYRPLDIRVGTARQVEVRLVPEHGAAGTWDPSDLP
jgi:hypothetical protein